MSRIYFSQIQLEFLGNSVFMQRFTILFKPRVCDQGTRVLKSPCQRDGWAKQSSLVVWKVKSYTFTCIEVRNLARLMFLKNLLSINQSQTSIAPVGALRSNCKRIFSLFFLRGCHFWLGRNMHLLQPSAQKQIQAQSYVRVHWKLSIKREMGKGILCLNLLERFVDAHY